MPIAGTSHRTSRTRRAVELFESVPGMSIYEAAKIVGVSYAGVYKAIKKRKEAASIEICPHCKGKLNHQTERDRDEI